MTGRKEKSSLIYVLDFGLSVKFKPTSGKINTALKKYKNLVGTARYASINAHKGLEQCRADDLESLAYMLIFLAKGQLPWEKIKIEDQNERYQVIKDKKVKLTPSAICAGLPSIFLNIIFFN